MAGEISERRAQVWDFLGKGQKHTNFSRTRLPTTMSYLVSLVVIAITVACASDVGNREAPDDCGWTLPESFTTMTRDEYESMIGGQSHEGLLQ